MLGGFIRVRDNLTRMSLKSEVVNQCTDGSIDLVRIFYLDSSGVVRGASVPADEVESYLTEGVNFARTQQAFSVLDYPVAGTDVSAPVGEVRVVPDPETFTPLPYAERTAAMVGSFRTLDGELWEYGPRARLEAYLEDFPFTPSSSFEGEFYLGRRGEEGKLTPFDESGCYAADGMQSAHHIVLDMIDSLRAQDMDLALYYPEYGPGQQEIVIKHERGIQSADNNILYKQTIKAIAAEHGVEATFMPKPFPEKPGSGAHLHLSLWDGDKNLFFDANKQSRYAISEMAKHFIAGVLEHSNALVALTAPNVVSYKRLQPQMWASAYAAWGEDNRETMVRVPSASARNPEGSTRIEYKAIDNTANPYLAILGLLAAGMDGIERELDPGKPIKQDPHALSDAEREERSIDRYPETLQEALDALKMDDVLRDALGEGLLETYLTIKREQVTEFNSSVTDWEITNLRGPF